MTITIRPELGVPIPTSFKPEEYGSLLACAKAAFKTREFLIRNGLVELDPENPADRPFIEAAARQAAMQFTGTPVAQRRPYNTETAKWLNNLLDKYNNSIIEDSIRLKNYVTTRLIEESDGEKASDRLSALEKLGKLSQLGMFAEKIEVSVTHRTTDELKHELDKKLSKYMGTAERIDTPIKAKRKAMVIDLDEELGFVDVKSEDNERI
jgi:hypothetical protein